MTATKRAPLEAFKFAVYIFLPIATIAFFNKPEFVERLITAREYIIFPAEDKRPPKGTKDDIQKALDELKLEKGATNNKTSTTYSTQDSSAGSNEPADGKIMQRRWFGLF